jgi:DnaJ family protein C protein 9
MAKGTKANDIPEQPPSVEEDLYKILGVQSDATPDAIKTAYRKSALKNHPGTARIYIPDSSQAKNLSKIR